MACFRRVCHPFSERCFCLEHVCFAPVHDFISRLSSLHCAVTSASVHCMTCGRGKHPFPVLNSRVSLVGNARTVLGKQTTSRDVRYCWKQSKLRGSATEHLILSSETLMSRSNSIREADDGFNMIERLHLIGDIVSYLTCTGTPRRRGRKSNTLSFFSRVTPICN